MLAKNLLHKLFASVSGGPFAVTFWDGTTQQYGGDTPQFTIRFHEPMVFDLLRDDPALWFGEAYMRRQIDVEGDLADLIALAMRHRERTPGKAAQGALRALARAGGVIRRSLKRQKADVVHHYDLGTDFFRLWLDTSMTYSCAYFRSPEDSLEQAQQQKIDHSLKKLRLLPEETLLDIGSGWGALVLRAAEQFGVRALGITLSEEQYRSSCAAIGARGLEERADVRLEHYDMLVREGCAFDKIVSIGMIEHVGKAHVAKFVRAVSALLKPGGLALLHHITSVVEGPMGAWFSKYIFPGSYIPTLSEMIGHLAENDFRILDVENLGPHYRLTLDAWSERFERSVPTVREQFGEEFVRMWRLYLRGASASFREGALEVHQILVSKGKPNRFPLTREDLYA